MNRLEELVEWLPESRVGALITSPVTREYLLGFSEGKGVLIVSKERCVLYVSPEVFEKAKERVKDCRVIEMQHMRTQLLNLLLSVNVSKLFVEPERMTVSEFETYRECLHFADIYTSDDLSRKLTLMRSVKTAEEIACIEKAQSIADAAYHRFLSDVRRGMTERQVAGLLGSHIIGCGADELAFPVSASSGENSAVPGAPNTDRRLAVGDFLVVRFGARWRGYCSQTTRTIAIGDVSERMKEAYNAVSSACYDAVDVLAAGRGTKLADSVARSTLNSWSGLDKFCCEQMGHGVGLEPCEFPSIDFDSRVVLRTNMVVTVAPAVRIPKEFGVCIEDMVLITEDGSKILSNTTKKLVQI